MKNAAQQTVCWPDRIERQRILFIYLFIYRAIVLDLFLCVRVKMGDINSQIRKKPFCGSVEGGGLLSVWSLEQCNISHICKSKTERNCFRRDQRLFFSGVWIEGTSTQLCIISIGFKCVLQWLLTAIFLLFFLFCFVLFFGPGSPPLPPLPTPLAAAILSLPPGRRHQTLEVLLLFKLEEEEGKKWKNSSKTDKRVDVWSLCRPLCLFVCLFACFIFVLFDFEKKKLVCQVDVFARGCAAPLPSFGTSKQKRLRYSLCLFVFFAISENQRPISYNGDWTETLISASLFLTPPYLRPRPRTLPSPAVRGKCS